MRAARWILVLSQLSIALSAFGLARPVLGRSAPSITLPAVAQEKLTLDQAIAEARSSNRDLQAARARLDQSEAAIEQAAAGLLPVIAAQGKYTRNYDDVPLPAPPPARVFLQRENQTDGYLNATVPLIAPSAWMSWKSAKKSFEASAASTDAADAQLLLGVASSFYLAAGADEVLTARAHAVEVAKKTAEDAQSKVDAGTSNKVESTRAQLALVNAQQALKEAQDARDDAYRVLATLIRHKGAFTAVAPEVPAPARALDDLVRDALAKRPEIAAYRKTIEAAKDSQRAATLRYAPTLSVFGTAHDSSVKNTNDDYLTWAAGAQLDWVLFDGRAGDAQRRIAKAQAREAELRLAQLQDTIQDDLASDRSALETKRAAVDAATRAVELSQESLDLIRAQHDAGRATQLDLLQAQDALVAAEVAKARARFDLGLASVQLDRAAGTFPR
jgi:outer membrane protein TolC